MVASFLFLCCKATYKKLTPSGTSCRCGGYHFSKDPCRGLGVRAFPAGFPGPRSLSPSCSPPSPTTAPAQDGAQDGFFFTSVLQSPLCCGNSLKILPLFPALKSSDLKVAGLTKSFLPLQQDIRSQEARRWFIQAQSWALRGAPGRT